MVRRRISKAAQHTNNAASAPFVSVSFFVNALNNGGGINNTSLYRSAFGHFDTLAW